MICTKCGENKPDSDFFRRKDGRFFAWCKACRKKQAQQVKKSIEKSKKKNLTDADIYPSWFSYNENIYKRNRKMIDDFNEKKAEQR